MTKLDELLQLNNTLNNETNWQTHVAKTLLNNSQAIQNYEKKLKIDGQELPLVTFDKDEFVKNVKAKLITNPNYHHLLRRSPKTGLWSIYRHATSGNNIYIYHISPSMDSDQEAREGEAFLKSQGITDVISRQGEDFKTNTGNDSLYSLNFCISWFELISEDWGNQNSSSPIKTRINNRTQNIKNLYQITESDERTRIETEIKKLTAELGGNVVNLPTTTPDSTVGTNPANPATNPDQKPALEGAKPTLPTTAPGNLPPNISDDWRDKLAKFPFLEQKVAELKDENKQQRDDFNRLIKEADGDIETQKALIDTLQGDKSQLKAERDHFRDKADQLKEWTDAFPFKAAAEIKAEFGKVTFTPVQQEAITNYPSLKAELEEWIKAFPKTTFVSAEQARVAYDEAIKNQKPADHDIVQEDLREWRLAFPDYKFPKQKPQDIRNLLDQLQTNQKPADYQSTKDKLEEWIKTFSNDPDLKGKESAEIKQFVDNLRTDFKQRGDDLLRQYQANIKRRVDNTFSRLEKVNKDSLNAKYQGTMLDIYPQLTLDNWAASENNLKIALAICAAEKADAWDKQITSMATSTERTTQTKDLATFLVKVERNWVQTPLTADKNYLFYLPILENQTTYRTQTSQLKVKYPEVTRRNWDQVNAQQTTITTDTFTASIEQVNK